MAKAEIDPDDYMAMRARLHAMTFYLEDVMEHGLPKPLPRRASVDAQSAQMEWWDERTYAIKEAKELLEATERLL